MARAISPSVHPDVTHLSAAKQGLTTARKVLEGLVQVEDAVAEDPTLTPSARLAKIGEFASRRRSVGMRALDSSLDALRDLVRAEESKIDHTLRPPKDLFVGQEFRHRLAGMDSKTRKAVLDDALVRGGGETMGAALALEPWLVGLTPAEAKNYRLRWAQRHAPDSLRRIEELNTAMGHVRRAGTAFMGEMMRAEDRAKEATRAAARTREAMAS